MTTRYDISTVSPQGGYVAKRCPVRIQNDVLVPGEPVPPSEEVQLRLDQGNAFEDEVFAELLGFGRSGWVFIDEGLDKPAAIAATVKAMEGESELIAGGFLPVDEEGRRTGKPDLLVHAGDGYVPVDVKHHLTLDVDDTGSAHVSPLTEPHPGGAAPQAGWALRKHRGDALQLAHYRRMLEAIGHASTTARGGIVGKEKQVVWYDLEAPMWQTPAKSDGRKRKTRTTMEIYDFEFHFRLDIAAVAHLHQADSRVDLLVLPLSNSECGACPWLPYCDETLCAGSGDPSLLPGLGFPQWRTLRECGITDRAGVAALHHPTAALGAAGVDLGRLVDAATGMPGEMPLADLIPRAKKQQKVLADAGVVTVADLEGYVDPVTADLGGGSWVPKAIENARAVLGDAPVYRRPGARDDGVPRADIEIDIDMENTNDGVYLWGALLTDTSGGAVQARSGYIPFATWEPLTGEVELRLFREFWTWLHDVIRQADAAGRTVNAYCWNASAENGQLRRIAAADEGLAREVADFVQSDRWVDLRRVFNTSWITGESTGLKQVAPLAGYEWPVDDPGGGLSMVRYLEATAPEPDVVARDWLLEYNKGDVEATARIRNWLDTGGASWPEVRID